MTEPGRLFDPDEGRQEPEPAALQPGERLVRVLPDVSGLDKEFDYIVPARWADQVAVGSLVRVDLHGRRVAGWVTDVDLEPRAGMTLLALSKVSSVGPPADLVDLARWAARRWGGRLTPILKTASPPTMVKAFPRARPSRLPGRPAGRDPARDQVADEAFSSPGVTTVAVGPADDQLWIAEAAAARGNALILAPGVARARWLSGRLGRAGYRVHLQPNGWGAGVTGGVVIGSRSAVWAPAGPLDAVLVLDEHDEAFHEERIPTWHARDVAIERAHRSGAPCVLVSPAPSLTARQRSTRVLQVARSEQRNGWPAVEVIDRRDEEPGRSGLFSPRAAAVLRESQSAVAVLNRKGRARMLACASCGELVKTEDGEHLMTEVDGRLIAPATGETRPLICSVCTGTSLKRIQLGVTRAAEELSRLVGREVTEVSSDAGPPPDGGGLLLGTEAVLHTGRDVDAVVFLDFDQELHAPRYRAAEQAMGLLVRAARMVRGRRADARLIIQTRAPEHRVLQAAVSADPGRMAEPEAELRRALGFPPFGGLAEIGGAGADGYVANLTADEQLAPLIADGTVRILGPRPDGRYLVRAADPEQLAEIMACVPRPKERVRVAVDPPRA
jgi:primosomal protein N' (replication factor Y)